uniref:BTB domain-containing protein n=1 Tax=Panagrellus redivivus TaxID=6233 RepID=A0A7E4VHT3_PANRE
MSADPNPEAAEILDKVGELYLNEDYSDVVFVVEGKNVPAHQVILSQRSPVFKAMFPPKSELQKEVIELPETSAYSFCLFLRFIYKGTPFIEKELTTVCLCTVFEIMTLAKTYELPRLVEFCVNRSKHVCATVNAVELINEAVDDDHEELVDIILDNVSVLGAEFFTHEEFYKLPVKALYRALEKPTSEVSADIIFRAFVKWMRANPSESEHFPELLKGMDLKSMPIGDIVNTIRPLNLVDANVLLDLVCEHAKVKTANGNPETGTSDVHVTGETSNYFVRPKKDIIMKHAIGSGNESITIDLERIFTINYMEMELSDGDWSYCIDVSQDNVNWTRIIDYSKYLCRSLQRLYFQKQVLRYFRIRGTAPADGTFEITNFLSYYTELPLEVDPETGCVIPAHNVALTENYAIVIQGRSWPCQNAMLNGSDDVNNYTFHHIGKDPIIVQLPQPYLLSSMNVKINSDCLYDYNIEVSTDKINWTQVINEKYMGGWRHAKIDKQPVVFIKLTGTLGYDWNVFTCNYLECPAINIR